MKWTKEYRKEYQKKWQKEHREIANKYSRDWQHTEKGKEYLKKLAKTPERKLSRSIYARSQKGKATQARYKINHPEISKEFYKEYYIKNKEKINKASKEYHKLHPEKNRLYAKYARDRKMSAIGSHTLGEWELLKKQYGYTCPCCEKSEPEIKLTEDHIVPLSKGGSNYIENIQPLCKSCNSKKHTQVVVYENKNSSLQFKK